MMNVIELNNITKRLGDFSLNQLNLQIKKGYITGLVGPNGSGKTSLISLVTGLIQADHGSVSIFGKHPHHLDVKQDIGVVLDDLYMYQDFTIHKMYQIIAPLYKNWNDKLFHHYVKVFQLPMKQKLKTFSKGMKMKTSLLFALSHEPKLLIFDEPTAGLDPLIRKDLINIIQNTMIREDQSVLFSTHITSDLEAIADYIIGLNDGKIAFQHRMDLLKETYFIVRGPHYLLDQDVKKLFISYQVNDNGFIALYKGDPKLFTEADDKMTYSEASIEDVLYYTMKDEHGVI